MFQPDKDGIYAVIEASPTRRMLAYGVLAGLGVLVLVTALSQPPGLGWLAFMLVFGATALWLAEKLRHATRGMLILTADDLRDDRGRVLARLSDIAHVDRGALAIKPAQGFTLVLRGKGGRGWAPGMWWQLGRNIGIGGVTHSGQSRFMAEVIAERIKGRAD